MASGLATVASTVGAADSMIKQGMNGLLIRPGDRLALRYAICRLAGDETMRRRLGREAVQTVRANYEISAVVSQLEAAFSSLTTK